MPPALVAHLEQEKTTYVGPEFCRLGGVMKLRESKTVKKTQVK